MEEVIADPFRRAFNWYDGHMGENPQDAIERRETREEMLAAMTDKQREVFILAIWNSRLVTTVLAQVKIHGKSSLVSPHCTNCMKFNPPYRNFAHKIF